MFWRRGRRDREDGGANTLRDEAEPNVLDAPDERESGADRASAGPTAGKDVEVDEDLAPEDELEDDELEDDELEDEEDEDAGGDAEPEDMSADLEAQAREYLADNDTWMYGPNAEAVIELLDRLDELDPDAAWDLNEAWRRVPKVEREVARKAIRRLTEQDLEVDRRIRLVREAIGNWMSVAAENPPFLRADADWPRTCALAGEAAMDAASALILEDDLDEKDYAALYGPWNEAVEVEATAEPGDGAALEGGETADGGQVEAIAEAVTDETDDAGETAAEDSDQPFGPNTNAVRELIKRLWLLPPEQVARLVSNWERLRDDDALREAHEALKNLVAEDVEYRDEVRQAQEQLTPWLNSGNIQETSAYLGRTGAAESHRHAGPALADAVAALVMGDLLERRHVEALYEPWFSLVGAPPLPEPEDEDADEEADEPGGSDGDGELDGSEGGERR